MAGTNTAAQSSFFNSQTVDIAGGQFNNVQGNITNVAIYYPGGLASSLSEKTHSTFSNSEASSISRRSNTIYEEHLTTKRIGYPLWIPQPNRRLPLPYRRRGISIGDVGILSKGGGFDFLFNVLLPVDDPINPKQMPDNFLPLDPPLDDIDICEYSEFGEGSFLSSGSVEHSHGKSRESVLSFKAYASDGAILTMPYGANSQDVANVARMKEYAAKHAEDWYKFANGPRGREARNGDLRLVIGCDKTTVWGMATFQNVSQTEQCELKFSASPLNPGDSNSASFVKYTWEQCGHAEAKTGPTIKESTELKRGDPTIEPGELYENQCLFVRTLNIMLGEDIWAASQPHTTVNDDTGEGYGIRGLSDDRRVGEDPFRENREELGYDPSFGYDEAVFVTSSSLALEGHPSDDINRELLRKNPHARVAITSDTEWGHLQSSGPTEVDDAFTYRDSLLFRITASRSLEQSGIASLQLNQSSIADLDDLLSSIREGKTTLECFLSGGYENCFSIFRDIVDTLESHYKKLSILPTSKSSGTSSDQEPDSFSALRELLDGLYSDLPATQHRELGPGGKFTSAGDLWYEMYRGFSTLLLVVEPDQEELCLRLYRQLTYALAQLFFSTGLYESFIEAIQFHMNALSGAKRDRVLSSRLNLQLFFLLSKRYLMTRNLNDLQAAVAFLKKQQLHCCHPSAPVNMDYGPQDLPVFDDIYGMISTKIATYGKDKVWPYPASRYIQIILSQFSEGGALMEDAETSYLDDNLHPRNPVWQSHMPKPAPNLDLDSALKLALMKANGHSQPSSTGESPDHTEEKQNKTISEIQQSLRDRLAQLGHEKGKDVEEKRSPQSDESSLASKLEGMEF